MHNYKYEDIRQESSLLKKSIDEKFKNLNKNVAMEYIKWLERKTDLFEASIKRIGYPAQPDDLSRGDVIWAEFGINIGTELSDYKTRGHYCVCWAVDLGNAIVIPLSSSDAPGSLMTYDIGEIEGLGYDGAHSYLKLDAIRSINKRRITRLSNMTEGKIHLKDEVIQKIRLAIKASFLN